MANDNVVKLIQPGTIERRGLDVQPELMIADGALGFWKAAGEVWPQTREQRCWVLKTANVLNNCRRASSRRQNAHCWRSGWPRRKPTPSLR